MSKNGVLAIVSALAAIQLACADGGSATAPSNAPEPLADPVVRIELTYTCNPCVNDPDNYALYIGCIDGRCAQTVWAQNPLAPENTLTGTARLSPGVHSVEAVVGRPKGPINVRFSGPAVAGNTGGVTPNSLRPLIRIE
jgi:hypothetical protein